MGTANKLQPAGRSAQRAAWQGALPLALAVALAACGGSAVRPDEPPPMRTRDGGAALEEADAGGGGGRGTAPRTPPSDGVDGGASCRAPGDVLACITRQCFPLREAHSTNTRPEGSSRVLVRYGPAGELAAFDAERGEPAWRDALACARACASKVRGPPGCEARLYLHAP